VKNSDIWSTTKQVAEQRDDALAALLRGQAPAAEQEHHRRDGRGKRPEAGDSGEQGAVTLLGADAVDEQEGER